MIHVKEEKMIAMAQMINKISAVVAWVVIFSGGGDFGAKRLR